MFTLSTSEKIDISSTRAPVRVLIQAINYLPEPIGCAKYTSELAEFLTRQGYDVEVVTAVPHYPGWHVRPPFRAWKYATETINSLRVIHCPIMVKRNSGGIWRLIAPLSFALSAAPILLWRMLRFRPDVLFCVEPTLLAAVVPVLVAKLIGARAVLHVQDLEVDAAFRVGHLNGDWLKKLCGMVEPFLLNRFDEIVTISGKMRAALSQKGIVSGKIQMIRNWVDVRAIKPTRHQGQNAYREEFGADENTFVVLYAGHIGAKQALHVLLDAARMLQDDDKVQFFIVGEGPCKASLQAAYAELRNVRYLPLQPVDRLNELMNFADLHVLTQDSAAADLVLPSKINGMLASGRPIAVTADAGTELHDLLGGIAAISPSGDAGALARAISGVRDGVVATDVARGLALVQQMNADRILPVFEKALFGDLAEEGRVADQVGVE